MKSHRFHIIEDKERFDVGEFSIIPFDVKHDVRCFGYLIKHEESGVILFATDCCYLPDTFAGLSNVLIECNYRLDILERNIAAGLIPIAMRDRVIQSHFSYEHCLQALQSNDLRAVNNIVLLHLSNDNSHAQEFKDGIRKETGKTVHIAEPGLEILLNKTPF